MEPPSTELVRGIIDGGEKRPMIPTSSCLAYDGKEELTVVGDCGIRWAFGLIQHCYCVCFSTGRGKHRELFPEMAAAYFGP